MLCQIGIYTNMFRQMALNADNFLCQQKADCETGQNELTILSRFIIADFRRAASSASQLDIGFTGMLSIRPAPPEVAMKSGRPSSGLCIRDPGSRLGSTQP